MEGNDGGRRIAQKLEILCHWEKIDIYSDWKSEESVERVADIESDFESMWREEDGNLAIFRPSDLVLDSFAQYTHQSSRPYKVPANISQIRIIPVEKSDKYFQKPLF